MSYRFAFLLAILPAGLFRPVSISKYPHLEPRKLVEPFEPLLPPKVYRLRLEPCIDGIWD